MTPQAFEESLRVVLAEYEDSPFGGMGIDYEALSHAVATSGTASVPTVSGNTLRRIQARQWLEEAARTLIVALSCPRQRQDYLTLVLTNGTPRTPREQALVKFARTALTRPLMSTRLSCWSN